MDKNKIGMIDYTSFLNVLEMSTIEGQLKHEKDTKFQKIDLDWEWTQEVINKLKMWFIEE